MKRHDLHESGCTRTIGRRFSSRPAALALRFWAVALAMLFSLTVVAQSTMTDAQIIDFVQKEQAAGTSQQQISIKLVQKGVTVQRLRQLRKKYENLGGQSTLGAKDVTTADRSRAAESVRNSQKANDAASEQKAMAMRKSGLDNGAKDMPFDENNPELAGIQMELNAFLPDSTEMLRRDLEKLKNKRKVFGRDIFNNRQLSFEPNMNIATPDDYVLGPGDEVYIDIYGASQKTVTSTVSPDGDVNIEGFGPVQVSGLTVSKANQRLRSQLGQRYASSNIRLTVGQTRTIMVNVMGEVVAPGTYTLSAFATVFHALYMAGGVNDIGTLRDIKVYRDNKLVSSVDIYDYILNGKLSGNVKLSDNDVIVVGPYDCLVNITGKVKRPMFYEMKKTETVGTLLDYAGGFTGDAYTQTVRVVRKSGQKMSVWNVTEFDRSTFLLADEDSVSVDSIVQRYENMVELRGAVRRPGMYQIGDNVSTVRDLVTMADGLDETAMPEHVVMHRMRENRTLEVLAFNLKDVMEGKEADIVLRNEDVLFIPGKGQQIQDLTLQIFGEVYYPGEYQYAEGMTVEDFILQAGGLKDGASTQHVLVSRRVAASADDSATTDKKSIQRNTRAETFEITLSEGFALDGKEGFRLQPFDEVYVGKLPGYGEQVRVSVDGEINYRGTYALQTSNARLSDIVEQAGGLTGSAWAKGARVIRKMDEDERSRRKEQLTNLRIYYYEAYNSNFNTVNFTRQEAVDSLLELQYIDVDEYVVGIELDKALKTPGGDHDITLRDGDKLVIPQYDATVRMSGEVNVPGSTTYKSGKPAKWYIDQAGGYTGNGWKGHAYVLYANGNVKRIGRGADIEPGCEVIVPLKPIKTATTTSSTRTSIWSAAVSAMGTAAALIITALR